MNEHMLWVEKYRPKKVEDCILPEAIKTTFQEYVNRKEIPNLLLSGTAGVGNSVSDRCGSGINTCYCASSTTDSSYRWISYRPCATGHTVCVSSCITNAYAVKTCDHAGNGRHSNCMIGGKYATRIRENV